MHPRRRPSPFRKGPTMSTDSTLADLAAQPHILNWIAIIVLAGIGYTVATVGMKYAALGVMPVAAVLVVAGFLTATLAEVFLLKRGDLAVVYVTITGVETLLVLVAASLWGEALDLRRVAGAACVVAGIALCSS